MIGFKLHVMRLNHVESFYAFLLHFHSEGSEEEGRPATASPHAVSTTHGQAAAKAPSKGAAGYGQGQLAREADVACRGSIPQGRPTLLVGVAARRGGTYRHGRLRSAHTGGADRRGGYRRARAAAACARAAEVAATTQLG
ncbi:hypothetical protein BHE74_00004224 [Ensete ventricosum]|nr:hypothetical protein BHE74_00004224 [Ensete ventricosum]